MTISAKKKGNRRKLSIKGDLTIYTAVACKQKLLEALSDSQIVEIDLSKVSEIDTAGVQVLLLAQREARQTGKSVAVTSLSTAARAVLDLYKLTAQLAGEVDKSPTDKRVNRQA